MDLFIGGAVTGNAADQPIAPALFNEFKRLEKFDNNRKKKQNKRRFQTMGTEIIQCWSFCVFVALGLCLLGSQ